QRTQARGNPARTAALATEACVWLERYSVPPWKSSPRSAWRAVTMADKFAIEPPDVRIPPESGGNPNSSQSHRMTVHSIWAKPGAAFHTFTKRFSPHATKSARAAAYSPPPG